MNNDIIKYIEKECGFNRDEFGSASVNFSKAGVKLIVFRSGKIVKDRKASHTFLGLPEEDALLAAKEVSMVQIKRLSLADRMQEKTITTPKDETTEDSW